MLTAPSPSRMTAPSRVGVTTSARVLAGTRPSSRSPVGVRSHRETISPRTGCRRPPTQSSRSSIAGATRKRPKPGPVGSTPASRRSSHSPTEPRESSSNEFIPASIEVGVAGPAVPALPDRRRPLADRGDPARDGVLEHEVERHVVAAVGGKDRAAETAARPGEPATATRRADRSPRRPARSTQTARHRHPRSGPASGLPPGSPARVHRTGCGRSWRTRPDRYPSDRPLPRKSVPRTRRPGADTRSARRRAEVNTHDSSGGSASMPFGSTR